jgi:hypothetical protein
MLKVNCSKLKKILQLTNVEKPFQIQNFHPKLQRDKKIFLKTFSINVSMSHFYNTKIAETFKIAKKSKF